MLVIGTLLAIVLILAAMWALIAAANKKKRADQALSEQLAMIEKRNLNRMANTYIGTPTNTGLTIIVLLTAVFLTQTLLPQKTNLNSHANTVTGSITPLTTTCTIPTGELACSTLINWTTTGKNAKIVARDNAHPDKILFSKEFSQPTGSLRASIITPTGVTFELYTNNLFVARTQVTGIRQ